MNSLVWNITLYGLHGSFNFKNNTGSVFEESMKPTYG